MQVLLSCSRRLHSSAAMSQTLRNFITVTYHDTPNAKKIAMLSMDDTKMNAFSFDALKKLNSALDEVESNYVDGILLMGNQKAFSAGFDLTVMNGKDTELKADLILRGSELGLRLFESKLPIAAAASGHALAMGAITLLCCDLRLGLGNSKTKIGLNEVSINVDLPHIAVEVAKAKMSPGMVNINLNQGKILQPKDAVGSAGYLDEVFTAPAEGDAFNTFKEFAISRTGAMVDSLKQPSFAQIKRGIRGEQIDRIKQLMTSDNQKYREVKAKL